MALRRERVPTRIKKRKNSTVGGPHLSMPDEILCLNPKMSRNRNKTIISLSCSATILSPDMKSPLLLRATPNQSKSFRLAILSAVGGLSILSFAYAQSSDPLIDKLVEKGILSLDEANTLRDEADKGFTTAHSVKTGLPDWVNSMRLSGDFRGRYEGFFADNPNFIDRQRLRYRLRFGFVATMRDNLEVGFRLSSGEQSGTAVNDPISTNASLQDNGSKKPIGIDLAYAKWTPINTKEWSASVTGGKMENPFVFTDAVFDFDYTPEGFAQQFSYTPNAEHSIKLNLGQFVLDELGASSHDPYLLGAQVRLESIWNKQITSSAGLAFLTIQNQDQLISSAVPDQNRGN